MKTSVGVMVLGIWLILHGLISLVDLHFSGLSTIMSVLALVAGALLLLRR